MKPSTSHPSTQIPQRRRPMPPQIRAEIFKSKTELIGEDAYREINFVSFRKSFTNLTRHYIVSSEG